MPRRIGPTLGVGTTVTEESGPQPIQPSPLGVTLHVGIMEKGEIGEVIPVNKLRDYLQRNGTFVEGSELPNAAFDFYSLSGGAGQLFTVRVTDGLEESALDNVTNRQPGTGEYVNRDTGVNQKAVMIRIDAKNGGRWGGRERVHSQDYTIATDLTETTLDTGQVFLEDEWKGATLKLLGVSSRTYTVLSNDIAGVLTVEADSKMASDLAAGGDAANNAMVVYLDTFTREVTGTGTRAGDRQAVSVRWKDGEEDQAGLAALDVIVDGTVVRSYGNLSLDPTNKWFAENVINLDPGNHYITATVIHTGSFTTENRPVNWFGEYKAFAGGQLTADVAHVRSVIPNTPLNDIGFVTDFVYRSSVVRQRVVITLTAATTFSVTTTTGQGAEHLNLPAGVVGTPYETTLDANDRTDLDFIPGFTVYRGVDDFESGDVITFDVDPFPVEFNTGTGVLQGHVEVDSGVTRERVLIESNTVNKISFSNLPAVSPTPATDISADLQSSSDIIFATVGGTIDIISDVSGWVQLTFGAEANIAALVATLDADAIAQGLPSGLFSNTGDRLDVLLSTVYAAASGNKGEDQFFEVQSADPELFLADSISTGTPGDRFRVEAPKELRGGYDGATPGDADFLAAYNLATSPIKTLRGRGLGLVKLATPGVTTTTIQQAGLAFAEERFYQYRVEIPANVTDEASAVSYINDTIGRNDFGVTLWPSYAQVVNPLGEGTILQTLTGAVHGREARNAANFQGYHKNAAGLDINIPNVVETPLGDLDIDDEITNPQGIPILIKKKGRWVIFGARTIALDPNWKFKHHREQMSHYELTLLESFDFVLFEILDKETRNVVIPVLRAFFIPEFQKRALRGGDVDEAAQIKVDDENNTLLDIESGDLNATIKLQLPGVVERFNIGISKAGISEAVGG